MKLSIGMIVKNEEKYLERCLNGIKPILDNVDSELIIADTGSTDRTVEIAKKFTDNVYYFEWINDFAAARNSTLERAKGEWYMYIDADEIAVDCTDIIDFFNSGKYKKFGSAGITIRNYSNLSAMDHYQDFNVGRLTAIKDGIKFVNPIHEAFSVSYAPHITLKFVVDHYGYVFLGDQDAIEFAKKKAERNLELLLKELDEQEKDGKINLFIYKQIADSYATGGDYEKTLESLEKGLALVDPHSILVIVYYGEILAALRVLGRNKEALEICEKYFSEENVARKGPFMTDCFVHFVAGIIKYEFGDYAGAVKDFVLAYDLYDKYINGKILPIEQYYTPFRVSLFNLKAWAIMLYQCCRYTGEYSEAIKAFKKFPYTEKLILSDHDYMKRNLLMYLQLMDHTNYSPLAELNKKLDDPNKEILMELMLWQVINSKDPRSAVSNLDRITRTNKRLEDTTNLYEQFYIKKNLTAGAVQKFISNHGTKGSENILCAMMRLDLDITPFITAEDFNPEKCVLAIYQKSQITTELFVKYDINAIAYEGLQRAAEVYVWALLYAQKNKEKCMRLFEKFGELGAIWAKHDPDCQTRSPHLYTAMIADRVVTSRKSGDLEQCLNELKLLKNTAASFNQIIVEQSEALEQELNAKLAASEFEDEMLIDEFKRNIRDAIDMGDFKEARTLVAELEKLRPNDPDLDEFKEQLPKSDPAAEFAALAVQFKQNIRALITAGEFDQAQALMAEYDLLCPGDPDMVELRERI